MNEVVQKVQDAINAIRVAASGYDELSTVEQRAVRHAIYQKTGKFGKALIKESNLLTQFSVIEKSLVDTNQE